MKMRGLFFIGIYIIIGGGEYRVNYGYKVTQTA